MTALLHPPTRAHMKPQARPFSVELKTGRRPLRSSHATWSSIGEPSRDDLPTRDIRKDSSSTNGDRTPLAAANPIFAPPPPTATSTTAALATTAASVFGPKYGPAEEVRPVAEPATAQGRSGRILP